MLLARRLLWLALIVGTLLAHARTIQSERIRYEDEGYWVGRAYFFALYATGDFNNPLWSEHWGIDQPLITEYYIGALLLPAVLRERSDQDISLFQAYVNFLARRGFIEYPPETISPENTGPDWKSGDALSRAALLEQYGPAIERTLETIDTVRYGNSVLIVITGLILGLIGSRLAGGWAGLLTAALFMNMGLILEIGLVAHADALLLFLFVLSLWLFIGQPKDLISCRRCALIGLTIGLCAGVKLNAWILLPMCVICLALACRSSSPGHRFKSFLSRVILISLTAGAVFVLHHPLLQREPYHGTSRLFGHRLSTVEDQCTEHPEACLKDPLTRAVSITTTLSRYGRSTPRGLIDEGWLTPVWFGFLLLGFAYVVRLAFVEGRFTAQAVLITSAAMFGSMILYVGLDWSRYCAPLIPFIALFQGASFLGFPEDRAHVSNEG